MKKISFILLFVIAALGVQAQSRKHIGNFANYNSYFNPAFTGQDGSIIRSLYRNQWTGFEDAPRTLFLSGEIDLANLEAWHHGHLSRDPRENANVLAATNAVGVSLLHDTFGPYQESQVLLSYSSRIRLSRKLSLRAGAAANYNFTRLDAQKLTIDNETDPEYQDLLQNNNQLHRFDINVGISLVGDNFYVGYGLADATKGKLFAGDSYLNNAINRQHNVQAGYRIAVSESFGVVANSILRYGTKQEESLEGQLKGVFMNTFWAGMGYRQNSAYTFTAGARINQVKFAYLYEAATSNARSLGRSSNEITLTYNLIPALHKDLGRKITIW